MNACERCGEAIRVVAIRPAGRGPATQLGACRGCDARYRRTGTTAWRAARDANADPSG